MGLPAGWVTDVPDLSRDAMHKALGNGVVPQQAVAALTELTRRPVDDYLRTLHTIASKALAVPPPATSSAAIVDVL